MTTNKLSENDDDDVTQPQPRNIFQDLVGSSILQLNVEGITHAKRDVIKQLALENSATVLLLQETHTTSDIDMKICGLRHPQYAPWPTYARSDVSFSNVTTSPIAAQISTGLLLLSMGFA